MLCPNCGAENPTEARFCMHCGTVLEQTPGERGGTQRFAFPAHTTCDRAAETINEWLSTHAVRITDARCTVDTDLVAGTLVPTLTAAEIDWLPGEGAAAPYRFGLMMDSRADFGLNRAHGKKELRRSFETWRNTHPETEVAGLQERQISVGWLSAWVTTFFFR